MTVIAYDRPVRDLIAELSATGHVTHTAFKKTSVTLHHNGGRLSHDGVLNVWRTRPASAHFDVDGSGAVAQFVKVNEYAWAVGDRAGNQSTISIEMANSSLAPKWEVADATWKSSARLAGWLFAKVIGSRPSKSNFFVHHHWCATACAGPYVDSIFDQILAEAQKAYDYFKGSSTPPRPASPNRGPHKSSTQVAAEVWAGKWGSGADRNKRLQAAGYNAAAIQALVNRGVGKTAAGSVQAPARKSVAQVATEVIQGQWGNGPDRARRLSAAGYNAAAVQAEVNRRL